MGSSVGRRLVLSLESEEGDLVADDILLRVDAELVDTLSALEATSLLVVCVDDLVGGGDDGVGGGEVVGVAATETELEVKVKIEVEVEVEETAEEALAAVVVLAEAEEGRCLSGGREGDGCDHGGLHLEACWVLTFVVECKGEMM